jgi:signal transduction histidine kinase
VAVTAERTGKVLTVAVADDGTGFSFSGAYTLEELELLRMGPGSIKQRVRKLGGELVVESRPGRGAELRIRIPL